MSPMYTIVMSIIVCTGRHIYLVHVCMYVCMQQKKTNRHVEYTET